MEVWRCDLEGKSKWQTDWWEAVRKQQRVGNADGQAPNHPAWNGKFRVKMKCKGTVASDQWNWGLGDQALFTAAILMLGCESVCWPWTSRQPQHYSAPSQLHLDLKVPTRVPWKLPDSPHLTTMAQMLQHAGEKGMLEIARLFKKFNKPCKKKVLPWLFSR